MQHVKFFVGLRRMTQADMTPHMLLVLFTIRHNPGASYTDVMERSLHVVYGSVHRTIGRLIKRGLAEDRRVIVNPKTPGSIYITQAGIEFLDSVLDEDAQSE